MNDKSDLGAYMHPCEACEGTGTEKFEHGMRHCARCEGTGIEPVSVSEDMMTNNTNNNTNQNTPEFTAQLQGNSSEVEVAQYGEVVGVLRDFESILHAIEFMSWINAAQRDKTPQYIKGECFSVEQEQDFDHEEDFRWYWVEISTEKDRICEVESLNMANAAALELGQALIQQITRTEDQNPTE